ncbi:MAG: DUF6390 family protein [Actinomycetota bacterium]|nr:DUF6390 family protein [Actinomycetota bacterium]
MGDRPWAWANRTWETANDGHGFAEKLTPGAVVAMHWGWICERLDLPAVRALLRETSTALGLASRFLARPRTGLFA